MTSHELPPVGSFLRAVGQGHGYCLRVIKTFPASKENGHQEGIEFERWGMADGTPIKDGHHDHSWMYGLKRVLPGVWKDEWPYSTPRWMCCPLYYRLMDTGPKGQMDLLT